MKITCIMCPVGCDLEVEKIGDKIKVTGNSCPRGIIYGEKEVTQPERIVTTIKKYKERTISLKTDKPIDKDIIVKAAKETGEIGKKKQASEGKENRKDRMDRSRLSDWCICSLSLWGVGTNAYRNSIIIRDRQRF